MNNQADFNRKLKSRLKAKAEWWRNAKHDPHGIGTAVYVALSEVASAIGEVSDTKPVPRRDTPGKRDWPKGVL